ncbi:GNAT family N-acetyltransferase [Simiduia curdlanivorans]|uniref:GNAT family N-acetyltransferase n=1 Tax=Simiduia curdlanivorans TaxID=1492769 RepID=A0ABV8V3M8_9GAMM|nr:GNAT family N-acetyltransferase [Simiduia curdlanivorans]MDN3638239.1 GNAT family N-acetyltransferase [Simiduia curdlanivorans]
MPVHVNNRHHLAAFSALKYAWIERFFSIEASDRKMLERPAWIIEQGGYVLTLTSGDEVVGCCALLKGDGQHFELAKMAVTPAYQGRGLSHLLMEAAIAQAKAVDAQALDLLTSSTLTRAIGLYQRYGFITLPAKCHPDYSRCDVVMQLDLLNH